MAGLLDNEKGGCRQVKMTIDYAEKRRLSDDLLVSDTVLDPPHPTPEDEA
jgi:hypothetical protein